MNETVYYKLNFIPLKFNIYVFNHLKEVNFINTLLFKLNKIRKKLDWFLGEIN